MDERTIPIFLVGSERSGTTLLRLMLDHHPELAFNLESEFLVKHIADSGEFPDVVAYRRSLASDRVFHHSRFVINEQLGFPELVNDFLHQKRERDGKRRVGATVHYQFRKLGFLWPKAQYIYLLRDGRDVASSVVQMGWAGNAYVGADWWIEAEREWAQVREGMDPCNWIEVRYEELTADPKAQLRRICDFLGVEFSERMFDYVETTTYTLPDACQNFKWRKNMRAKDLRLVEARIGHQLAARGYELSSEPLQVSSTRDKCIRLQSTLGAFRQRIASYGFWLVAIEFASRHVGWIKVHSAVHRAIDKIINENLK